MIRIQSVQIVFLILGFGVLADSFAQQGGLEPEPYQCVSIKNGYKRLTCYEQCISIKNGYKRLTCYDQIVGHATAGSENPNAPRRTSVTGGNYENNEGQLSIKAITGLVNVISVKQILNGKYVFVTEDGQVWTQTDVRKVSYKKTPFAANIRPATLGSYYLKPESGGVSVRVRREE